MDYGIRGRKAIVCAASQGLGKGCALALAREGVDVVINARGAEALHATAAEIRDATGVQVTAVVGDVTSAEGRAALLAACPQPDILVNNAGGPPIGDFRDWDEAIWQKAVNDNMITPIMLIRAVVDGMIERRFGRIVNVTSRSVKAPLPAPRTVERRARGPHRVRRRPRAPGREAQRDDQQPPPRALRHRPPDRRSAQARRQGGPGLRHVRAGADGDRPGESLRHAGGVRAGVRIPVQHGRQASSSARTC